MMSPKGLMTLGVATGLVAIVCSLLAMRIDGGIVILTFAGGMMFGKGYGVWEERSRRTAALEELAQLDGEML